MSDDKLLAALRARAIHDAEVFRDKFPRETPNEKWIDNSFTAALPLAAHEARSDFVQGDPQLFAVYAAEVERILGMRGGARSDSERDRKDNPHEQLQEPTAGEH